MKLSKNDSICLAILKDLEDVRLKFETDEIHAGLPDWIVRFCETKVANHSQWKSRADWVEALKATK